MSFSPAAPDVNNSSLSCNVSTSDADGDSVSLSYQWDVDGSTQSETSSAYSGPFVVATTITCTATPNDGQEQWELSLNIYHCRQHATFVDSVSLSPATVYTNDTITATASVSDDDSKPKRFSSYAWHVVDAATGTDSTVASGSGNTLSGSFFSKDDEVYVVVTPNDGVENGTSATSSSITISNTAPAVSSVSVSPAAPSNDSNPDLLSQCQR